MKIPKFLKPVMATLIVIALIRSIFNAPPISLKEMLVELESFEFNVDPIIELVNDFTNGSFDPNLKDTWDENEKGVEGFFVNIGRSIKALFNTIKNVLVSVVYTSWSTIIEIVKLFGKILSLIFKIIGLNQKASALR